MSRRKKPAPDPTVEPVICGAEDHIGNVCTKTTLNHIGRPHHVVGTDIRWWSADIRETRTA